MGYKMKGHSLPGPNQRKKKSPAKAKLPPMPRSPKVKAEKLTKEEMYAPRPDPEANRITVIVGEKSPAKQYTGDSKEINRLEDKIESLQHSITDDDPSSAKSAVMKRSIARLREKLAEIRNK